MKSRELDCYVDLTGKPLEESLVIRCLTRNLLSHVPPRLGWDCSCCSQERCGLIPSEKATLL